MLIARGRGARATKDVIQPNFSSFLPSSIFPRQQIRAKISRSGIPPQRCCSALGTGGPNTASLGAR